MLRAPNSTSFGLFWDRFWPTYGDFSWYFMYIICSTLKLDCDISVFPISIFRYLGNRFCFAFWILHFGISVIFHQPYNYLWVRTSLVIFVRRLKFTSSSILLHWESCEIVCLWDFQAEMLDSHRDGKHNMMQLLGAYSQNYGHKRRYKTSTYIYGCFGFVNVLYR